MCVVYKEQNGPAILEIPMREIELIEFESFLSYRGVSAKTFVVE